ncbi:MAG: sigma-70 family RNA polymerase sigma factor [Candidatus Poribacteria bacterium]|nr:sigma-70 family RNA polymerase sigma factor [Candidatus Poribacteria bacterium]
MQNRVEPNPDWSDADLVRTYRHGAKEAWDILYLRHSDRLRGFFFNWGITNAEDLNDLVQETLLEAMVQINDLQKPESFPGWLNRIALGKMGEWLKKADRRREVQESLGVINNLMEIGELSTHTHQVPERKAINKEHLQIAFNLIEQLPPSENEAFWLYLDGMKNTEIAEKLGIKASTVNVRIHKAKKKMRTWLKAEYPEVLDDLINRGIV